MPDGSLNAKGARFRYPSEHANIWTLLFRVGLLLMMIFAISFAIWLHDSFSDVDQYRDSESGENTALTPVDAIYFTVISITTTGYGDITPVTQEARLFDVVILSIGRIIMWVMIVGTAYQFVFERFKEVYRMKKVQKTLSGHVVICGYGTTGRSAARELVAKGKDRKDIVVIDRDEAASQLSAERGFVSIQGDPAREEVLENAMVRKAATIMITTDRDDSNVLITLTAKYLNPKVRVISQVMSMENEKLLKKSGVDVIIAPKVTGGNLMATAMSHPHVVELLEDVMTARSGTYLDQRKVRIGEVGSHPKKLPGMIVMGVVRDEKLLGVDALDSLKLRKGDELLVIRPGE